MRKNNSDSVTTGEAARICGISRRTMFNYCSQGKIESVLSPVTRRRRIPRGALERFLHKNGLSSELPRQGGGSGVLIVDDDPATCELAGAILRKGVPGAAIRTAINGYDALLEIGRNPPAVVVLDIDMPGIDGLEVCRRLKRSPGTSNIRVILMTHLQDSSLADKSRRCGADVLLRKPQGVIAMSKVLVTAVSKAIKWKSKPMVQKESGRGHQ